VAGRAKDKGLVDGIVRSVRKRVGKLGTMMTPRLKLATGWVGDLFTVMVIQIKKKQ
jgi:hypothetical protein